MMELEYFYEFIDGMSVSIGVRKQTSLKAYVNQAQKQGKLDQITQGKLVELSQLSHKNIVKEKNYL